MISVSVHTDHAARVEAHMLDKGTVWVDVLDDEGDTRLAIWGNSAEQLAAWLRGAAVEVESAATAALEEART